MAGDRLTVDGTDPIVLVIPAGMTGARAGDQGAEQTEVTKGSDMPAARQQQVLGSDAARPPSRPRCGPMPATQHQQAVLARTPPRPRADRARRARCRPPSTSSRCWLGRRRATSRTRPMPATQHQQQVLSSDAPSQPADRARGPACRPPSTNRQVLGSDAGEATQQTAPRGQMPATQHQQAVLAQATTSASVIEADVEADNGVIHVIDAVLVPEDPAPSARAAQGRQLNHRKASRGRPAAVGRLPAAHIGGGTPTPTAIASAVGGFGRRLLDEA